MADKYCNYAQLASVEGEGLDYSIRSCNRRSHLLILGCHAGGIEPGTSELVMSIAETKLSYYLFEGLKANGNGELHITSTNFDEPKALRLLELSHKAIAFHGEKSDDVKVYLGGRDDDLLRHIEYCLNEAGFETAKHGSPILQGTSYLNICNKCSSSAGLQLELPKGLRKQFFPSLRSIDCRYPTEKFHCFVRAIRAGIDNANLL